MYCWELSARPLLGETEWHGLAPWCSAGPFVLAGPSDRPHGDLQGVKVVQNLQLGTVPSTN